MVREYINGRIKDDPKFIETQQSLEREEAVVPVALELGMVMLQRAQGQADVNARKEQLKSAEQVFLAIGGVAGESDAYRLSLGQVDYWLGKQAEGRKLFDDFLAKKQRAAADLLAVGYRLRQLGSDSEARALAEEAYNKASKPEERHQAADLRSLCFKDLDDQIAWLNNADTANPDIKATLARATGDKALEEGRDDEAVRQYRIAIETYAAMPRSAGTVNETARAYSAIFWANGDRQSLERCVDYFQQAVDLNPTDPILLYNAGTTLLSGAISDIIGNQIDLRTLHESGNIDLLGYLYKDEAGRAALADRVKGHPAVGRALSILEKAMVLSPRSPRTYESLYSVYRCTHDLPALRALAQRIKGADIDHADHLAKIKDYLNGTKDGQSKAIVAAEMSRSENIVDKLRSKGGPTAGAALRQQVVYMIALDDYGSAASADQVVKLAEEASRAAPSVNTKVTLMMSRPFRAAHELRRSNSNFDSFYRKYYRSVGILYLMAAAASEPSAFQQDVLRNPDVRAAVDLARDDGKAFPDSCPAYCWALLKSSDPVAAEKAAGAIRNNPRQPVNQSIDTGLQPYNGGEHAPKHTWLMQILGKPGAIVKCCGWAEPRR